MPHTRRRDEAVRRKRLAPAPAPFHRRTMHRIILLFASSVLAVSAFAASNQAALKDELIRTEREFAADVAKGDIRAAFLKYMAPDGFAPGDFALSRAELAAKPAPPPPPTGFKLEWEPLFADVSDDGTLGYTWGYAKFTSPAKDGGEPKVGFGMTLTIWKKQPDGSWKWVFDGGPAVPREKIVEFLKRTDLPRKPALLQ
jgi:hypothetical protein